MNAECLFVHRKCARVLDWLLVNGCYKSGAPIVEMAAWEILSYLDCTRLNVLIEKNL